MHARYYHSGLARFTQADTIVPEAGNPQAHNRYAYVANNPLARIDPSGHGWAENLLIGIATSGPVGKALVVNAGEAVHALNDPVRSPSMEGIRQTAGAVGSGAQAWGGVLGMAGVAADYTVSAAAEGRWSDAARGATGLGQMGNTVAAATGYATAEGVKTVATAPFRDAWNFGVAAREYAQGNRSGWDLALHSLCLTGDVLAIGSLSGRLSTSRISPEAQNYLQALRSEGQVVAPRGSVSASMMGEISTEAGAEVGLFRLQTGERVLALGGPHSVPIPPGTQRIIAHTHPGGILQFSAADISALTARGQLSSVLIDLLGRANRVPVPH
jgi:hypothetical protein